MLYFLFPFCMNKHIQRPIQMTYSTKESLKDFDLLNGKVVDLPIFVLWIGILQ